MDNLILSVDFDRTLFSLGEFPEVGKRRLANRLVAWYVRRKKRQGWTIILNTLREPGKGLEQAVEACRAYGIPIDLVNSNDPRQIKKWGESRKIGCSLAIDDRNIGLVGWLLRKLG